VALDKIAEKGRDKARMMVLETRAVCKDAFAAPAPAPAPTQAPAPVVITAPEPAQRPAKDPNAKRDPRKPIVVARDGTGDFTTIESALERAPEGATILLKAGLYRLQRPLQLTRSITLAGEGRDSTRLVSDGEGYVLSFQGVGTFAIHDITIEHQGAVWARVVQVESGRIDMRGCRLTGGTRDEVNKRGGEGLWLTGTVEGNVAGSEFIGNGLHGIKLSGSARPLLEGNLCQGNRQTGIAWFESSAGVARGNTCNGNNLYGMAMSDRSSPDLDSNRCDGNRRGGLYVEKGLTPKIRDNRCELFTGMK